jgi:iron complex transport system ATP-binding protein
LKQLSPVVEFSHVTQYIQNSEVLSDLSFTISTGEKWAVVGPNGSGKTTVLKIINGYLRPSDGIVTVLGGTFGKASLPDMRKKAGFVSSYLDNLLISDDNVLDIVVSGSSGATRLWGMPPLNFVRRARRILKELGCLQFEDRKLSELSQGERQKVLIGRSLMADPSILTLDEPCAPLDLGSRESFLNGIDTIAKDHPQLTMIYVTHRIDEIPSCFTKAILLKKGKLVAMGEISKVITSENLSECFDVAVDVKTWRGRMYPVITSAVRLPFHRK